MGVFGYYFGNLYIKIKDERIIFAFEILLPNIEGLYG